MEVFLGARKKSTQCFCKWSRKGNIIVADKILSKQFFAPFQYHQLFNDLREKIMAPNIDIRTAPLDISFLYAILFFIIHLPLLVFVL